MDTGLVNCAGNLLEPFATQSDRLQTDRPAVSLSLAILALYDLLCECDAMVDRTVNDL